MQLLAQASDSDEFNSEFEDLISGVSETDSSVSELD